PDALSWLTQVDPDALLAAAVVAIAALYLTGVWRLGKQGRTWPRRRTIAFLGGVVLLGWTLLGGPMVYGQLMFSAHLALLLTITLVIPPLWALGAPVTLALEVLPRRADDSRGPREHLLVALGSRWGRFWARPVVTTATLALSVVIFHA